MGTGEGARGRLARALANEPVAPPVRGFVFVGPSLVPGASGADPVAALARAAARARLDFCTAPSWEPWAGGCVERAHDDGLACVWAVGGVLTPALAALGHVHGLRAIARDPALLRPALDEAAGAMLAALRAGVALGADAVIVADDLASDAGPVADPAYLRAEVMPRLALAARAAGDAGLPAVLHSDGAMDALVGDIRAAGFSGVHLGRLRTGFDRAAAAARAVGLVAMGGLEAAVVGGGGPRAVAEGTRLAILAQAGGVIIADDGGVSTTAQYAGLLAALGAAVASPHE